MFRPTKLFFFDRTFVSYTYDNCCYLCFTVLLLLLTKLLYRIQLGLYSVYMCAFVVVHIIYSFTERYIYIYVYICLCYMSCIIMLLFG